MRYNTPRENDAEEVFDVMYAITIEEELTWFYIYEKRGSLSFALFLVYLESSFETLTWRTLGKKNRISATG